jgi:thioredoxin
MKDLTTHEVKSLLSKGEKVLVDFWAPWCGPCKTLIPRLESLSNNYPNVHFVKINVEENRDFAMELGIRNVPTVVVYDGETIVGKEIGARPDNEYVRIIESIL